MAWTVETTNRARELVAQMSTAKAAEQINAEFGTSFSKNAVIGKANRHGFVYAHAPKPKRERGRDGALASNLLRHRPKRRSTAVLARPEAIAEPSATGPVRFSQLLPQQCRWPLWDNVMPTDPPFCGAAVLAPGCSYCARHSRIAWRGSA